MFLGTRALRPKFLESSQNSWDFLGLFGIGLGSLGVNPKPSQNIPSHPKKLFIQKNLGCFGMDPKTSQNIPRFLGSFGEDPKHIGVIPKKLGSFWDGFGVKHVAPKQSQGSQEKTVIYVTVTE